MNPGDTLIIDEPGTSLDSHLWIVISDPAENPEEVLLVNFTKYRADKDQACIVERGDHPFISQKTCVEYRGAKMASAKELQTLLDSGQVSSHKPASPQLLARIRAGVANSRMRNEHVLILIAQGVIDPGDCGF
jgi:hypothetical protein